ncbi:MAG TPA: hypothetical protein VLR94_02820, partial [Acidobacteriota bacterium]|nr:hypothetical protein [Acidobacteriota bacterium]
MIRSAVRFRGILILLVTTLLPVFSSLAPAEEEDVIVLEEEKPAAANTPKPELSLAPDKEVEVAPTNYQAFYDKWRFYIESVQKGDVVAAQNAAGGLLELKKSQSMPKLTEFAISALRLGRQKLDANDPRSAQHFFGIATQLDPTLPAAYYDQAIASLKRGISGIGGALVSTIQGFLAPRQHLRGRVYFNSKMLFLGIAALMLAAAAFALTLLLKYNHLLHHDAVEKYSRKAGPPLIHLAVWLILFAPVLLFLGVLWLAPYWLMIFIRYARIPERVAALILIPVFVLAGPAFQKAVNDAALLQDSGIAVFYTVFLEGPSPRAIQDLQNHLSNHPDDWDSAVLLASLYQRNQMLNQAIELLQKLMSSDPQDPRPPNNLASIYFSRGEMDYALQLAQKAEDLDSGNATYKFNLSNIYRAKFDFNEANSFMSEARGTNAALVDELEQTSHEKVMEVVPTPEILTTSLHGKTRSFAAFLWNPFSILGTLLFVGAVYGIVKNGKLVTAKECIKCGKAFCKK